MKKAFLLILTVLCCCAYAQIPVKKKTFTLPKGVSQADYLPGVVIVKFKPAALAQAGNTTKSSASSAPILKLKTASVSSIKSKFPSDSKSSDGTISREQVIGLDRIYELHFTAASPIEAVINELLQNEQVEYAEPSYIYHTYYTPNDPLYPGNQSYLSQVRAPQAWDIIRNASGIIIAIVDSGSELTHQDLVPNIYFNAADPINGVDDDHDGYVDNYRGWDFVGASASNIIEDNDPNAKSAAADHGIHVSGIASAATDNNLGIASIAFNAKLMIIKAGADENGEAIYRGYDGIKYAADHGAQIINCSWGSVAGGAFGQDVVNYAISKGCLITAAAGNSNVSVPEYPSAYAGVMAVANVASGDVKSGSSNYGSYVSVSAPGTNILSTVFNNSYGIKSGTSMAAPMVASAAALVKSFYPALNMQQVGEKLRATADNIDAANGSYAGQLGKGRINVYRALTENPPSVRKQKMTIVDNGNGSLAPGETVELYFDLKNFLSPVTNLQVSLSSTNPNVSIMAGSQTVASLGTMETKTGVGPFKVLIKPGTPDNEDVLFRLDYSANSGSYQDFETFNITVALDYVNIEVNKVATTLTSNGRVGYSENNASGGIGFSYLNQPLLYEASLIIGTSTTRISNNARTQNSNSDEDFVRQVRATRVASSIAAFEGRSEFDDSGNTTNPLNVYIKHRQIAFSSAPDDKYTIAEYQVINNNTDTLKNVYIGMFTDWDIDDGSSNFTRYDELNRIGYVQRKSGGGPIGAVKLLNTNVAPAYYPLTYNLSSDFLGDGDFSDAEKFQALSSGIKKTGLGDLSTSGYDVSFVSGCGPFTIAPKGSVTVAFAYIGGDDLADIQKSGAAAQSKYNLVVNQGASSAFLELKQNYPNPFPADQSQNTTIQYSIPEDGHVNLSLYDLLGRRVKTYVDTEASAGLHVVVIPAYDLENGIYVYRLRFNNQEKALKLNVFKQ
ncbi:MAG: family serine peptidase [Sphingobacteriaceae bacterium]|jgi:hypothetical protein|nr:family serine peptidase [Sphingobacteriaceae bacterium]